MVLTLSYVTALAVLGIDSVTRLFDPINANVFINNSSLGIYTVRAGYFLPRTEYGVQWPLAWCNSDDSIAGAASFIVSRYLIIADSRAQITLYKFGKYSGLDFVAVSESELSPGSVVISVLIKNKF